MLSRLDGYPGSPEELASEAGKAAYQSYWKKAIFDYMEKNLDAASTKLVPKGTVEVKYAFSVR